MKNLSKHWKTLLPALLLALANHLAAQTFYKHCLTTDPPDIGDEKTLCEEFSGFKADRKIGPGITLASSLNLSSPWLNGENIEIFGAFILDEPVYFLFCNVKMGSNAEILTIDQYPFVAIASNFFACENMWEGITINEGSLASIWSSHFEDAKNTLIFDDNSTAYIDKSVFNRNYISIRNKSGSFAQPGPVFLLFRNNTFDCNSELLSPHAGEISFAGIYLTQCATSIGSSAAVNTFQNIRNGIYSDESSLVVQNCKFDNMISVNGGEDEGVGINCIDGSVDVDGFNQVFNDCELAGIYSNAASLNVIRYTFQGRQKYGVASFNNLTGQIITIANNTFNLDDETSIAGVALERSVAASGTHNQIVANTVNISADKVEEGIGMIGIFVSGYVAVDNMKVASNDINISSPDPMVEGIAIGGLVADNFFIINNDIDFTNSNSGANSARFGIHLFNILGEGHSVSYNNIAGSGTHNPAQCAFHIGGAQNVNYCGNEVNHTEAGFHFLGLNSPSLLTNNTIHVHDRGLYIEDGSTFMGGIGSQIRRGNTWSTASGAYTSWAAECTAEPTLSYFLTESSAPSILPPLRNPGGDDWFRYLNGPVNYCPVPPPKGGEYLTKIDSLVANGSLFDSTSSETLKWSHRRSLYYKLLRYPDLVEEGSAVDSFFTSFGTSTFAEFAKNDYLLYGAMQIDSTDQAALDSLHGTLHWLQDSLRSLDNTFDHPADSLVLDTTFVTTKQVLLDSLLLTDSLVYDLEKTITAGRAELLDSLLALNDSIGTAESYEAMLQIINHHLIKAMAGELVDSAMYSAIDSIAAMSSGSVGPAVSLAQGLLPLCDRFQYLSDSTGAAPRHMLPKAVTYRDMPDKIGFELAPNPATTHVWVKLHQAASGRIRILDVSGKVVRSKQLEKDRQYVWLPIADLAAGIYLVSLHKEDGMGSTKKLVISK